MKTTQRFKLFILLITMICSIQLNAQLEGNGEILGTAIDTSIDEALGFAPVLVENEGTRLTAMTNEYGIYYVNPVPEGTYSVSISYMGRTFVKRNVKVRSGKAVELNFDVSAFIGLPPIVIEDVPGPPLIDPVNPYVDLLVTDEDINNKGVKTIEGIIESAPFVFREKDEIHIKGARVEATKYMIDGMSIMGLRNIPITSIESVEVIASGMEAKYGDATGGIVYIRTKGYF